MRQLILFMGPPGMKMVSLAGHLIDKINSNVTLLTINSIYDDQKIITISEYIDLLFEFSERLTHTINDSRKDEIIIVSGFFSTPIEREYIYNAIKRANYKIDRMYGIWVEDASAELKNNLETNEELFEVLFKARQSPTHIEEYYDIYYVTKVLDIGTSKKHSKIYSLEKMFEILAEECDNIETN